MNNLRIHCCAIVAVVSLAGCGGGGSSDNDSSAEAAPAGAMASKVTSDMLQFPWLANCFADSDGTSLSQTASYVGSEFYLEATWYDNSNCTDPIFAISLSGDYLLGKSSHTSAGAAVTDIDMIGDRLAVRPATPEIAERLNSGSFCDRSDWRAGESLVVSDCDEYRDTDLNYYDIIELRGDTHHLGETTATLDGSAAATRPVSIDYSITFSRAHADESALQSDLPQADSRVTPPEILDQYLEKLRELPLR